MKPNSRIIVIGGGAAGYFCAINIKDFAPATDVIILEKTGSVLSKVRISGGGRCNVTNRISEPAELVKYYPRGERELLGPFTRFTTSDTIKWFEVRGVKLKTENDGRIFPVSNDSAEVVNCFHDEVEKHKIKLVKKINITEIIKENEQWRIITEDKIFYADCLVIASGSNHYMWELLKRLGHKIIPPVPSLFTFNIQDERLKGIPGLSVNNVSCRIEGFRKLSEGPLLVTHWGLSGPSVLKLSAYAARYLHENNYKINLNINWVPSHSLIEIKEIIESKRTSHDRKIIFNNNLFDIPLRLWEKLMIHAGVNNDQRWLDISNKLIKSISEELHNSVFQVNGKSTFKEEFVTAGGIDLKEVNFKTMESKIHKRLYFSGEVLDIDAVTGGFNFQSAWTTAFIAARGINESFGI